ncbi:MAG TPA: IMP dehydrogenase, partial [Allocoleopsis sp.]
GGIKNSGDIVKSLCGGASAVMIGSLLAGTTEAPGNIILDRYNDKYKIYRGSASFGDKKNRGEKTNNIEGTETLVPYKGPAKDVVKDLIDGIRSGCSYAGVNDVKDLRYSANFVHITQAGLMESKPHGK